MSLMVSNEAKSRHAFDSAEMGDYNLGWVAFALGTMWLDQRKRDTEGTAVAMG